jgi:hypothetical protein
VNPATLEHVQKKMSLLGWAVHQEWSKELRHSAHFKWFKSNVAVYVPVDAKSALPSPVPDDADRLGQSHSAAIPPQLRATLAQAMATIAELNANIAKKETLLSRAAALMRAMQAELAELPV